MLLFCSEEPKAPMQCVRRSRCKHPSKFPCCTLVHCARQNPWAKQNQGGQIWTKAAEKGTGIRCNRTQNIRASGNFWLIRTWYIESWYIETICCDILCQNLVCIPCTTHTMLLTHVHSKWQIRQPNLRHDRWTWILSLCFWYFNSYLSDRDGRFCCWLLSFSLF